MNALKCILIASCILQAPLATVKISILLFYKRIFSTQKFGWCVWAAISLVAAWGILFFLLVLFEGEPISASWGVPGGRLRFDAAKLGLAQVGTSIALDMVVLCFPLPVISRLHLQNKRKVLVGCIFWLGSFCCIAAIVRLILLHQAIEKVLHSQGYGQVYIQSRNCVFMILEANCSIIAACLPCYGPLFRGGRSQGSLVASVRSMFSLRSRRSDGSLRSTRNFAGFTNHDKRSGGTHSATESEIELKAATNLQGPGHGHSRVVVERLSHQTDEEAGYEAMGGINVTKGVEVTRS
ncbi:hypothetical protein EJ02DRAFT_405740 [Clathrospora elynae]|uniref:Rhodopsin domain-containing protein n=1 Tax=Clathrospora elynae TaxID=706981 RepID=A0A6A5SJS2_9PLEO|nr:hypothetical protein EJ02DRAFT_405740 [Clathrospora elynae]